MKNTGCGGGGDVTAITTATVINPVIVATPSQMLLSGYYTIYNILHNSA